MNRNLAVSLTALALVVSAASSVPAQIAPGITNADRQEFARRRAAVYEQLGDEIGVAIGAPERTDYMRFRQFNRFYYLAGVEIPQAALIMDGRSDHTILFLPPAITTMEGSRIGPGPEAVAEFGIADVRPIEELEATLISLVGSHSRVYSFLYSAEDIQTTPRGYRSAVENNSQYPWLARPSLVAWIRQWLENLLPGVEVLDISEDFDHQFRVVKSAWELSLMTEACRIAGEAFMAAWRATRPGVMEWEIAAAAKEAFVANGSYYDSYPAIVAAGPNTMIAHYGLNNTTVDDGEIIMMDYAPDYRYYSTDITRTWPANGRYTERQRQVYLDCLEIEQRMIDALRPGLTPRELYWICWNTADELGYTNYDRFTPFHTIGMCVHGPWFGWDTPIQAGETYAIEPGLYLQNEGWGARIEDVVLVTEAGGVILSDMIPRHPDEIEAIMAVCSFGGNGANR